MVQFVALENGTLSNPYRFIVKESVVDLTDEEAVMYLKSKWLRPVSEKRKPVPPIMSHMAKEVSKLAQPYQPQESSAISSENYNANIAAIQAKEAIEDGKTVDAAVASENEAAAEPTLENTGGDAAQGTGNQEVI
jgi:hypothetical protein